MTSITMLKHVMNSFDHDLSLFLEKINHILCNRFFLFYFFFSLFACLLPGLCQWLTHFFGELLCVCVWLLSDWTVLVVFSFPLLLSQQEATMLPVAVLAVCLSAALSAPALDAQLDDHWNLWKGWHNKKYHEVMPSVYTAVCNSCGKTKNKVLTCCCCCVERGRLEEDDLGEEPEEDRAAQPGALHGRSHLPSGHEPLWRHGESPDWANTAWTHQLGALISASFFTKACRWNAFITKNVTGQKQNAITRIKSWSIVKK